MTEPTLSQFEFDSQMTYTFVEEIGRGGMGIVYLASRNSGGVVDYVVLKTLKSLNDEDEKALHQEANLAAQLRHENIVKTYGLESIPLSALPEPFLRSLGALSYVTKKDESAHKKMRRLNFKRKKDEGVAHLDQSKGEGEGEKHLLLMAMDYIDGINLNSLHYEHIYQSLLIPCYLAAFVISRIARALAYAHNYLIHRDVSPENILLNTQGICKLSDFGISVATHKQPDYWAGKLSYMAPEQLFNQPIDERVDIFSLGSVAYQIITGIPLIQVNSNMGLDDQINDVKKQLAAGIISPSDVRSDVPQELSAIIMKMLSMNPDKRYTRASTVANDLEKKFLYAKGFGPTNNSMATYMAIFENRFSMYNEEQLEQLSFLKGPTGEIQLKRPLSTESYTPKGMKMIEERVGSEIFQQLQLKPGRTTMTIQRERQRLPYLKLKYLDNVIESFMIGDTAITIGSGKNMVIFLDEKGVSQHHCSIERAGAAVILKSATPASLVVNDTFFIEKELREGDKIKLGRYTIFFIKQTPLPDAVQENVFHLDDKLNIEEVALCPNFSVNFTPDPESLTILARLADQLLSTTNLSELKLGVIPTALIETIQLLKTDEKAQFHIRIIKTPVRLIFHCKGFSEEGYNRLLNNFIKHRQRLADEMANSEKKSESIGDSQPFSIEDLMSSQISSKKKAEKEKEEPEIEDIDTSMLAAMLIVHGFDRIEAKRQYQEVELVVYL